jgi:hypothetical protein
MSTARESHTLALLPDGRVLVAGGTESPNSSLAALDSVEIFDPSTGIFSAGPSMNHARIGHTATVLADGRVLVVGGTSGNDAVQSAEVFDPAAGTWTDAASPDAGRTGHTATLLPDGRVLVVGGSLNPGAAEVYDPGSGVWLTTEGMTAARQSHAATLLLDERVLVTGGVDDSNGVLTSSELWLGASPDS